MLVASVSEFRKNLKTYLDRITDNFETLIINRGNGAGIVVMSLEEYNSVMVTLHELSSKKNEERLDSAIKKLEKSEGVSKSLTHS